MAITRVAATAANACADPTTSITTLVCTLGFTVGAGHFLFAAINANGDKSGLGISDNGGTPGIWTIPAAGIANNQVKYGYCFNTPGGATTVTFTWTGGTPAIATIVEYNGTQTGSDPLDQTNNQTQGGGANTTYDSLNITTTGSNDLILGVTNNVSSNTTTSTSTSGMTIVTDNNLGSIGIRFTIFENLNKAAGTYNNGGNFSAGSSYGAVVLGILGGASAVDEDYHWRAPLSAFDPVVTVWQ